MQKESVQWKIHRFEMKYILKKMHIRYVYLLHSELIISCISIEYVDISNHFINIAIKFVSLNSRRNDVSIIVVDIVPVALLILPIITASFFLGGWYIE